MRPTEPTTPALLWTESDVQKATQLSVATLRKDRVTARRIPFLKIGAAVRYDPAAVMAAVRAMAPDAPTASMRGRKARRPLEAEAA